MALCLTACASRREDAPRRSSASIQALSDTNYVDLEDFASELALVLQRPASGQEIELVGFDERRILLFPGTRTVSVAGTTHELSEPLRETGGVAWVSRGDAVSMRALWHGTDPLLQPVVVAPPYRPASIPGPPDPIPFHAQDHGVAHAPHTATPAAPPTAGSADASRAERRAWGIRLKRKWQYLVIHHSASPSGSASSFHKAHRARGWDGLGYHFVIGNGKGAADGAVQVGYRWKQQKTGAHAGNKLMNERGIGICLVGNFQVSRPSARQMAALGRLCRFLSTHCGISAHGLKRHKDVRGTACPGRYFPKEWTFRTRSTRFPSARR